MYLKNSRTASILKRLRRWTIKLLSGLMLLLDVKEFNRTSAKEKYRLYSLGEVKIQQDSRPAFFRTERKGVTRVLSDLILSEGSFGRNAIFEIVGMSIKKQKTHRERK